MARCLHPRVGDLCKQQLHTTTTAPTTPQQPSHNTDEAFGAALNVISTNAGGIGNALSDQILPLISTILSGHILSTPYPVLRGGNYPTLDPGTSLNINSTTRVVTPRATDGSRGAFGNVLPPVTLEDLEGEEACNAYVYTLEGFVIVSPSIFPQLITASG